MILLTALSGALLAAGILGVIVGWRPVPVGPPAPKRQSRLVRRVRGLQPRTRLLLAVGAVVGLVVWLVTGWWIAVVVLPAGIAGLPVVLSPPASTARIGMLDALEEWTRALAGVLTVGVGLEEALRLSLRSTPELIRPQVSTLVARLRAGVPTEAALRGFGEDLDDPTGDLVVMSLINGAQRRGPGLTTLLGDLADSVANDVANRRKVEADRSSPRTSARLVTLLTLGMLVVLAATGQYLAPYGSPIGQLLLAGLLTCYVMLLVWLRAMTAGDELPRLLGPTATRRTRS